jgi:hypothetical protein
MEVSANARHHICRPSPRARSHRMRKIPASLRGPRQGSHPPGSGDKRGGRSNAPARALLNLALVLRR